MNRLLLFFIIVSFPLTNYAQLGTPNIVSYPCYLASGVTGQVIADSVPGATVYEWTSTLGHINAVWFPSIPSPVQTTAPSVNIMANMSLPVYEICVRAMNSTDTSAWSCIQIMGSPAPPVFSSSNNPVATPGDSAYYAVVPPVICPPTYYSFTITGDATFNNNSQSIVQGDSIVNINFGPNFTSGMLCVAAGTYFGLFTDTVCMIISYPSSLPESEKNPVIIYYQPGESNLLVELESGTTEIISCRIVDVTGKVFRAEDIAVQSGLNQFTIHASDINDGIYFLELTGSKYNGSYKFFKTD